VGKETNKRKNEHNLLIETRIKRDEVAVKSKKAAENKAE
jgi:hypothetical protein